MTSARASTQAVRIGERKSAARDEGAILPLILVLIVITGLLVLPLMSYSVAILRANSVQSDRSKNAEAAKGGIRVALDDPGFVFDECDGGGSLTPGAGEDPVIDAIGVTVTCSELEEIGPLDIFGYEIPAAGVAMQLGATVPTSFAGVVPTGPGVLPGVLLDSAPGSLYEPAPTATDPEKWWNHPDIVAATGPSDGHIWLPQLRTTGVTRSAAGMPLAMPSGFDVGGATCEVYLPGTYDFPITVSGPTYFASGVYYFTDEVKIEGDANVIVGQGNADFGTGCAKDLQVISSVMGNPGIFSIDGGGGTWIFGDDGHLIVDNSATTSSLSLQFNRRYSMTDPDDSTSVLPDDLVSIVSVNGQLNVDGITSSDHFATDVSEVPVSTVRNGSGTTLSLGTVGAEYLPSAPQFTDAARLAEPPSALAVDPKINAAGSPPGTALLTWPDVTGQDAGGTLVTGFEVVVTGPSAPSVPCQPSEIVPQAGNTFACLVTGLTAGADYDFTVATVNTEGVGAPSAAVTANISGAAVSAPDEPVVTTVAAFDDAAEVTWGVPDSGGAPIVRYEARAYRVQHDGTASVPPFVELPPTLVDTCSTPFHTGEAADTTCVIRNLPDLTDPFDLGYRFSVVATNSVGDSTETILDPPSGPILAFDGPTAPADPPAPTPPAIEAFVPEPIIDIVADGSSATTVVSVSGAVVVPMGRIEITNMLHSHEISMKGSVVAGTYDISDARSDLSVQGSLPIGFINDVVLQRKVRIISTAGNTRSVAIVQINEDGASYSFNAWATQ